MQPQAPKKPPKSSDKLAKANAELEARVREQAVVDLLLHLNHTALDVIEILPLNKPLLDRKESHITSHVLNTSHPL